MNIRSVDRTLQKSFRMPHSNPLGHAAARNRRPRKTFDSRWYNFVLQITRLYELFYKQFLLH